MSKEEEESWKRRLESRRRHWRRRSGFLFFYYLQFCFYLSFFPGYERSLISLTGLFDGSVSTKVTQSLSLDMDQFGLRWIARSPFNIRARLYRTVRI